MQVVDKADVYNKERCSSSDNVCVYVTATGNIRMATYSLCAAQVSAHYVTSLSVTPYMASLKYQNERLFKARHPRRV